MQPLLQRFSGKKTRDRRRVRTRDHDPCLKRLKITVPDDFFEKFVETETISANCPHLESLFLSIYQGLRLDAMTESFQSLRLLKELVLQDTVQDLHVLELLTGEAAPSRDLILRSVEQLKTSCPPLLRLSQLFIVSDSARVGYGASESLSILLLPFIPESHVEAFLMDHVDANIRCSIMSTNPLVTAMSATHGAPVPVCRTGLACADILVSRGADIFAPEQIANTSSILHLLVELHRIPELAHLLKIVQASHPDRLLELVRDSCGFTVFHSLNFFPSGSIKAVKSVFVALTALGVDLLNDQNNSEGMTAVSRFVAQSCSILSQVKKNRQAFECIVDLVDFFKTQGADLTRIDSNGCSVLTHLFHSQYALWILPRVMGLLPSAKDVEALIAAAPAAWVNKFLEMTSAPIEAGSFELVWKTACKSANNEWGLQCAFRAAMLCESPSDDFVWELVSHVINCGYDPSALIEDHQPWISLSPVSFPPRVLLFAEKLGWDLGWYDERSCSLLSYSTKHAVTVFSEQYAKAAVDIFDQMRRKPLHEKSHYARAVAISGFAGNFAYHMLSESQQQVDLFTSAVQRMATAAINDFLSLGSVTLSSPRACWCAAEELVYVGVANSLGQGKAADLLTTLGSHVDKENCLGNSSIMISAVTHCCLATEKADLEWYAKAFSIFFSDVWKEHRFESRHGHKHPVDVQYLEVVLHLMTDRSNIDARVPMIKICIDALSAACSDFEGVSIQLFVRIFSLCNAEIAHYFASSPILAQFPMLVVRLVMLFLRKPADFHVAYAILDMHPTVFASTEPVAGDWALRSFCYSLDAIHGPPTIDESEVEMCVAMIKRLVAMGARTDAPFADDYKRQFKERAREEITAALRQTKVDLQRKRK